MLSTSHVEPDTLRNLCDTKNTILPKSDQRLAPRNTAIAVAEPSPVSRNRPRRRDPVDVRWSSRRCRTPPGWRGSQQSVGSFYPLVPYRRRLVTSLET